MTKQENFDYESMEILTPNTISQRIKSAIENYKKNRYVNGKKITIKLKLVKSVITLHFKSEKCYVYPVKIAQLKNETEAREIFNNYGKATGDLWYSKQTKIDLGTVQSPWVH